MVQKRAVKRIEVAGERVAANLRPTLTLARAAGDPQSTRPALSASFGVYAALNHVFAYCSLVSNAPVLDIREFEWTGALRSKWREVRDEALQSLAQNDRVTQLLLWSGGRAVHSADCPTTAALIAAIPGIDSAAFTLLPPGAHRPLQRGASKALLTCHLGLLIPREGDGRISVADRVLRWADGETLMFDDTHGYQMWNESGDARVLLTLKMRRPLRQPGRWLADLLSRRARG